jgi:hypothetical protein
MHRLDTLMAFVAADTFGVGLGLGLVDPVALRRGRGPGEGNVGRDGGGRKILGEGAAGSEGEETEERTPNIERRTSNVEG